MGNSVSVMVARSLSTAACALLLVACSSASPDEGGVVIREEPTAIGATAAGPPAVPSEASAQILREERVYGDPAPLGPVQSEHGVAPVMLDLQPYTFGELGIELTIEPTEYWRLDEAAPGYLLFTTPDAGLNPLLPAFTVHRPVGFANPFEAASGRLGTGPGNWEPDWDLASWIAAVPQLVVLDQGERPVGDRTARWFDVAVDPMLGPTMEQCQPGSCVAMMWSGRETHSVARAEERIRWYEIPDPEGPIVAFVSASDDQWPTFVAAADELLATATLGPSAPNPVVDRIAYASVIELPSNETWLTPAMPGIELRSPTFYFVFQRPGEVQPGRFGSSGRSALVTPVADVDGSPLTTAAEVVTLLTGVGGGAIVGEDEMLGYGATVVDLPSDGTALVRVSPQRTGFDPTLAGWPEREGRFRLWVFDSPLGPTMVTAFGAMESDLDAAIEAMDWFTDVVTICDPPTDSCDPAR